jgi:hypothetical protein
MPSLINLSRSQNQSTNQSPNRLERNEVYNQSKMSHVQCSFIKAINRSKLVLAIYLFHQKLIKQEMIHDNEIENRLLFSSAARFMG